MKKMMILLALTIALLALSACGGAASPGNNENEAAFAVANEVQTTMIQGASLSTDYANALSAQGQLALGTLQLEETDLAVDEALAAELLPLWQALQSLSNSDTAAEAEIKAVANQIQDTMTAEQIAAIASMELTEESLTALTESGELTPGRDNFVPIGVESEDGGGGFPTSGFPGGGPGGGEFPGGGFGDLSEEDRATRQAQFAESDSAGFQDRLLTGAVVRLLQGKTGETPEPSGIFDTVYTILSEETGLSIEDIQAQAAEGANLNEIIEANGGNIEDVRASLVEALNKLPNAGDLDAEQIAADWLGQ